MKSCVTREVVSPIVFGAHVKWTGIGGALLMAAGALAGSRQGHRPEPAALSAFHKETTPCCTPRPIEGETVYFVYGV